MAEEPTDNEPRKYARASDAPNAQRRPKKGC